MIAARHSQTIFTSHNIKLRILDKRDFYAIFVVFSATRYSLKKLNHACIILKFFLGKRLEEAQ
jgi:hypothetical protein